MTARAVGIDALNLYGGSMALALADLARARGVDPGRTLGGLMVEQRAVFPPWEDVVTMAATAARPLVEEMDRAEIGLLVVGTESGIDYGKPISTQLLNLLGLGSHIRNYEVKHACYSGVAALTIALDWIRAGHHRGRKALVIASDASREHLGELHEYVLGGCATAMVVGEDPRVLECDPARGTWSSHRYDTFRPTALREVGNGDLSLLTYLEALEESWTDYCSVVPDTRFTDDFDRLVFHTPFAGMASQAHRTLCGVVGYRGRAAIAEDFARRVRPSLAFAQALGSPYASSNFAALASLVSTDPELPEGARVGCFSYGSGAIGEWYRVRVMPGARAVVARRGIPSALAERRTVTVAEYEANERARTAIVDAARATPARDVVPGLLASHYDGRPRLVLDDVRDYQRIYRWGDQ